VPEADGSNDKKASFSAIFKKQERFSISS